MKASVIEALFWMSAFLSGGWLVLVVVRALRMNRITDIVEEIKKGSLERKD